MPTPPPGGHVPPLAGVRVVELAGIGPAPLAGMILADLGASVVVVDRPDPGEIAGLVPRRYLISNRGKRLTVADLKSESGIAAVKGLLAHADILLEGFRPGTLERLGLGPGPLAELNPALVYCRLTGWGQEGPRSKTAGHDIDYIAMTGALLALGRAGEPPVPPANLLGDYAGGTMFAVVGALAALLVARQTGRGQVVDAAMADGVGVLLGPMIGMLAAGTWRAERGTNLFDTGAPFYDVYRTADGGFVALGALETRFFEVLARGIGLSEEEIATRLDRARWPALRARIAALIGTRSREEWAARFADTDACLAPVLSIAEAAASAEARARGAFVRVEGVDHPAPAPRLSGTPLRPPTPPPETVEPIERVLREWAGG